MESSGIPKISIDDTKYNISYLKLNYLIPIYKETFITQKLQIFTINKIATL